MDDALRNELASSLERLADQTTWNEDVRRQTVVLVEANHKKDLLANVCDDLIHYSGLFHSLFGRLREPDRVWLEAYCQEFRDTASALRLGLSLAKAKKRYEL